MKKLPSRSFPAILGGSLLALVMMGTLVLAFQLRPTLYPAGSCQEPDRLPASGPSELLTRTLKGAVQGCDDRVPLRNHVWPFAAVGRLVARDALGNLKGTCAATLIGEGLLVTAAHCVIAHSEFKLARIPFDQGERVGLTAEEVALNASSPLTLEVRDREGKLIELHVGEMTVKAVQSELTHEDLSDSEITRDVAFLRLDLSPKRKQEVRQRAPEFRPVPLANLKELGQINPKSRVSAVGSPTRVREPEWLSYQPNCSVLHNAQSWLRMDCDATPGNSGGPVFHRTLRGDWLMVGLVSSSSTGLFGTWWEPIPGLGPATLAVSSASILHEQQSIEREQDDQLRAAEEERRNRWK